eukprot:SAG22_NODE_216_length_14937_cov_51.622995_7_plen_352_part_00
MAAAGYGTVWSPTDREGTFLAATAPDGGDAVPKAGGEEEQEKEQEQQKQQGREQQQQDGEEVAQERCLQRPKRQRTARVREPGFVASTDSSISFAMSKDRRSNRAWCDAACSAVHAAHAAASAAAAAAAAAADDDDDDDDDDAAGELCCEHCSRPDDAANMVLCDGCDTGHHIYCVSPRLPRIPSGSWFCNGCMGARQPAGRAQIWGDERLGTSVFASDAVRKAMTYRTWQNDETDEPALDESGTRRLPIFTKPIDTLKGVGAFASRSLEEGEFIGEYSGEIITAEELKSAGRRTSQYIFDLGDGFSVDARAVGEWTDSKDKDSPRLASSQQLAATPTQRRPVVCVCVRSL